MLPLLVFLFVTVIACSANYQIANSVVNPRGVLDARTFHLNTTENTTGTKSSRHNCIALFSILKHRITASDCADEQSRNTFLLSIGVNGMRNCPCAVIQDIGIRIRPVPLRKLAARLGNMR